MGVINQVGALFGPDKRGPTSTTLETQRQINSNPQASNTFMFAELASAVLMTNGGPAEPFTWNVAFDSISLNYVSPFSTITLFAGVWQTQVRLFAQTSDASDAEVSMFLPSNDIGGLSGISQYVVGSGFPLLFSETVFVPDPLIQKTLPYSITDILGSITTPSGGPSTTMTVNAATLSIKRLN